MPELWKKSMVVPLYKGERNVLQGVKVVECMFEKRLRKMVEIREKQYQFVAGKGTTDAIFILRQLQQLFGK